MGDHLWKQCADWLCRLEVLPANHRIMWPDATIQDLAYTLRDGVLLCHIAATLDPTSIDPRSVNQRPQMAQFLCLKNIRAFLQACSGVFGIKDTDLFQPSMLYDYSDFARVLHTLSRLSNSPKARARISGFPGQAGASASHDDDQIYKTLEELANEEEKYEEFYYRHHGGWGYGRGSQLYAALDQEEVVYEDLCSFKRPGQDQDEPTSSQPTISSVRNFQPKEKRDHCIKELVDTEGNYVEVLNMIKKNFIRGLISVKDADKKTIFMNIPELFETHSAFYSEIKECILSAANNANSLKAGRRKFVAEVFLDYKSKFLIYGQFCATLQGAQQTLDGLVGKSDAVRDDVARCEQQANGGRFRLRDLLAVPMQRVLKYHLLLRELLSHTSISHEEYPQVQQAYEAMLDVADYINEVKRDSEQLHIIREIQASITDWTLPAGIELKDYGRLRKDGEIKIQSHDANNAKAKVRYIFIFDRVMLMCKSTRSGGDHYTFKDSLNLSEYKVQDFGLCTNSSRWSHSFMLVHAQNVIAYTLVAKTDDDKRKWMTAIQEALHNVYPTPRYSHDVSMCTFEEPTSCQFCSKLLKGLFYQGYRCNQCHCSFHKNCIGLAPKCGTSKNLNRKFSSTTSLDRSATTPPAANFAPQNSPTVRGGMMVVTNGSNPDYINTRMEDHPWFVGAMERDAANKKLADYPNCTFLVRCRVQNGENVGQALSLKTETDVKHMKICTAATNDGNEPCYYLSDTRKFRSVVELVAYFSRHSLKESFSGLDTTLRFPIGELSIMEVLYDYSPAPADRNLLPLKVGDRVTVLDRSAESQGWLKAYNGVKIGYIPKNFVAPIAENS